MTKEANEKLIMLAQMTSESEPSALRSLVQVYLPIFVFIIVGVSVSATGVWFTKEWETKLGATISSSIQDNYFNDVIVSLSQIGHDSVLLKSFFDASDYVSKDEFEIFTNSLLTHNVATEFCLIIGYNNESSQYYYNSKNFNTENSSNELNAIIASETVQSIFNNIESSSDRNFVITTADKSYIAYSQIFNTDNKEGVIVLTGVSSKNLIQKTDTAQAAIRLTITDEKNRALTSGEIDNDKQISIAARSYQNLNIVLNIHQKIVDENIFLYFRWIIVAFSILASLIFSVQFLNARRSIRNFIDLTIKRTDELTTINSDLVDEIMERARLQTELLNKNHEISDANEQLKEAKSQLIQKEKLASLGQLSAGIAHEINNPIGFVKSNLSMLKKYSERALGLLTTLNSIENKTTDDDIKSCIEAAKKEYKYDSLKRNIPSAIDESLEGIDRVKQIIHDLKMFSRMEESEWLKTDIHMGIESTLNIIRSEIKDVADIHKEYGDIPEIECMASQINQVILNLLVNAVHAVAPQGKVTIRTYHDTSHVYIQISDDGCGIEQEIIDRIFDPFFTTKGVGQGTGLGLSLSYGIIEKHNGHLTVESTVGVGTTFTIKLPIHPTKEHENIAPQATDNE